MEERLRVTGAADHASLRGSGLNSKIGFNCWGGELEALEAKKRSGLGKAGTEHCQGGARLEGRRPRTSGRGARPIQGQSCPPLVRLGQLVPNVSSHDPGLLVGLVKHAKGNDRRSATIHRQPSNSNMAPIIPSITARMFLLQAVLRPLAALRLEALCKPLAI